jgi:hypothetical protein
MLGLGGCGGGFALPLFGGGTGLRLLALVPVAAPIAIDATGRIDQLLLAGEERVAGRADLHPDLLHGRSGLEHVPADAHDLALMIGGVNLLLHLTSSLEIDWALLPGFCRC